MQKFRPRAQNPGCPAGHPGFLRVRAAGSAELQEVGAIHERAVRQTDFEHRGLILLADGLTRVRIALDARPFGIRAWWLILVSALVTAILGVVLLFHPGEGTKVLTQLLGISLMVDGVMNIGTILTAVRILRAARPVDDGEDYELVDD